MRKFLVVTAMLACGIAIWATATFSVHLAVGQDDTKSKAKGAKSKMAKPAKKKFVANTSNLDVRADQVQSTFIKEAEDLANQYTDAGHFEKAKVLLQSVLTLNPKLEEIQQKIKKLDETILSSNDFETEVNPGKGWESANAMVFENRPIRFTVEGQYRFVVNSGVGAGGFAEKDPVKDMIDDAPCGALMGLVLVNGKPGKPFVIGEGRDYTPKENGLLFVRVNAPADNKNTGRLKVSISGYVKSAAASDLPAAAP